MKRTALLSVFDKTGIVEFAEGLVELDWTIYASGGTAKTLLDAGLPVKDVSELAGGEAILGHRVVTLSREVYAGLLARSVEEDLLELERLGIPFIDLVCVDLYPLVDEIASKDATPQSVNDKTDIGGPTMLRAAAKGQRIVISQPDQRQKVLNWLRAGEQDAAKVRLRLAKDAVVSVADYELWSARYLNGLDDKSFEF